MFTKELIKKQIQQMMKKADNSYGEYDFLAGLGSVRNDVVYDKKLITSKEFDEICEEILEEMGDDKTIK